MASEQRSEEDVRREIEAERERLVGALDDLRGSVREATDVRRRLPVATAAALGAGFVLGGGLQATLRLVFRLARS